MVEFIPAAPFAIAAKPKWGRTPGPPPLAGSSIADEVLDVGVELVRVGGGESAAAAWVHFQRPLLQQLRALQSGRFDRHDLVVIAVRDENRNVDLLQILGVIDRLIFPRRKAS